MVNKDVMRTHVHVQHAPISIRMLHPACTCTVHTIALSRPHTYTLHTYTHTHATHVHTHTVSLTVAGVDVFAQLLVHAEHVDGRLEHSLHLVIAENLTLVFGVLQRACNDIAFLLQKTSLMCMLAWTDPSDIKILHFSWGDFACTNKRDTACAIGVRFTECGRGAYRLDVAKLLYCTFALVHSVFACCIHTYTLHEFDLDS